MALKKITVDPEEKKLSIKSFFSDLTYQSYNCCCSGFPGHVKYTKIGAKLPWPLVMKNRLNNTLLRKMASEGGVGTTDAKAIGKLIAKKCDNILVSFSQEFQEAERNVSE